MSNEYWDNSPETEEVIVDSVSSDTYIRVNGSNVALEPGSSLIETVKSQAKDAGLGKFRVFMNGEEIRPSEAPDTIAAGTKLELRPYDVAGA